MRLCFIGASRFGLRCLQRVVDLAGLEVAGAVTAPRKFSISYRPQGVDNVLHADVEAFCQERAIECTVLTSSMNDSQLIERVRGWAPDVFLVAGWYHIVPKAWREMAPAYGLHASLLPDYRGGAPLVWAIINGESRTGISLFQLGDGVDDGPILGQAETEITAIDSIATLYARIEDLGLALIDRHFPQLAAGTAVLTAQDESRRRVFPQRGPEDGVIDWQQGAARIHDFIRAQTRPYPGAFTPVGLEKLTIWSSCKNERTSPRIPSAHMQLVDGRVHVGCGDGDSLVLDQVRWRDADMSARDWWESRSNAS